MNQKQALEILKTGVNIFLTGEPGSGKTYTINQYVSYLISHGIEPAITASTGIAATHISGTTIHSWSGIGIKNKLSKAELHNIVSNDYIEKRIKKTKVLIIDEISMLPPDSLEMVDLICKEVKKNSLPFGGIQVVLVGDFFQLPPIVKKTYNEYSQENLFEEKSGRFSYDSSIWRQAEFVICYLDEQYRQDDHEFLSILTKIRANKFDSLSLEYIHQRKIDSYQTPANTPKLYTHNIDVDLVNDRMLSKIQLEAHFFPMKSRGHESLVATMKKGCLSPESLFLKIGAAVMFTKNSPKDGFVNGTLGTVTDFDIDTELPIVKIRNGRKIVVSLADWTVEDDGKIKGRLTQIPLRLAWAITVHKSQGISLDEAIIDLSKVFEFGQGYVALSRVRRLTGLYILGWNELAFQVDAEVLTKDKEFRHESAQMEKIALSLTGAKLKKIQDDFIINCGGQTEISNLILHDKKKKISTYDETLNLWQLGLKITEIAKARHLSEKTIFSHIEELIKKKKIKSSELQRIVPATLSRDLAKIQSVFKSLKTDRLTPVFEHFRGKYSYDEIKIAKIIMER
jgi:hypothetical protein